MIRTTSGRGDLAAHLDFWSNAPVMYPDHSQIQAGDSIRFDQGRSTGDIVAVISDDFAEYNVSEPGVMVKAPPFGLVFIPASRFAEQRVALERRGTKSPLWRGP